MDANNVEEKTAEEKTPAAAKPETKAENLNAMALISYIGILAIVPFLAKEEDQFVKFHARQGLTLFIGEAITWFIAVAIPFAGFIAANLLGIVWVVLSIIGIINVVNGKKEKLPVIGDLADKLKF